MREEVEVYGTPAGAMPTPTLTLRTSKTTYAVNEEIVVDFTGMPGNQSDWISLAKQGAAADQYESGRWDYTNGERNGTRKFTGLPAGQYEARAYFNWPSGGFTIVFGTWWGSIVGEVRGNTLVGTYSDEFGSGSVRIELSADRKSCTGNWWDADGNYGGVWDFWYNSPLS